MKKANTYYQKMSLGMKTIYLKYESFYYVKPNISEQKNTHLCRKDFITMF